MAYSEAYGSRPWAVGQGNDIIDSFVAGSSSAKRSGRTTAFNAQLRRTASRNTRRQRRVRNGPRLFGFGTETFGFAAAPSLACRATHIPLSAPRFAISSSLPHRYYVLQSRTIVRRLYQLYIRFTSRLHHLPFSTFQGGRLLSSCCEYLMEHVKSRYTPRLRLLSFSLQYTTTNLFYGLLFLLFNFSYAWWWPSDDDVPYGSSAPI